MVCPLPSSRWSRPLELQALPSLSVTLAVVCWFWAVSSHRIHDAPAVAAHAFVTGCGDFEHFCQAALALRDGRDIEAAGAGGNIYPPLIAFVFMPLTHVSVRDAAWIMLVVNLALAAACAWLACTEVMRRFGDQHTLEQVLPAVALTLLLSAPKLRIERQMRQTDVPMGAADQHQVPAAGLIAHPAAALAICSGSVVACGHRSVRPITSGIVRALRPETTPQVALLLAGGVGVGVAWTLQHLYAWRGMLMLHWPAARDQTAPPAARR